MAQMTELSQRKKKDPHLADKFPSVLHALLTTVKLGEDRCWTRHCRHLCLRRI